MSQKSNSQNSEDSSDEELPKLEMSRNMSAFPEMDGDDDYDDYDEPPPLVQWNKHHSVENSNVRVKINDKKILGVKFRSIRRKTENIRKNSQMKIQLLSNEDDTIEEEPNDESDSTSIYEEIHDEGDQNADIDLKSLLNKLKIEEQLELVHPEIQKTYGDGIKMQQYTPGAISRMKERKILKQKEDELIKEKMSMKKRIDELEKQVNDLNKKLKNHKKLKEYYEKMKDEIDLTHRNINFEEDARIKTEKIKELQKNYKKEVSSLREIIKKSNDKEFMEYHELREQNEKYSQENFYLKNQLTSEKYKNERIHREIKEYAGDVKTRLANELKEANALKQDLVKEKAKMRFLQNQYNQVINRDVPIKEMVTQKIDRQNSLWRLDEYKMEEIIDNKTKEIIELLNKEESEISPIEENTKTIQNDGSFLGKQSMFDEVTEPKKRFSNISGIPIMKPPKKTKSTTQAAFEYNIEEDELSYRSSLHPDADI